MGIEGGSNGALDLDWQQKGNPPEIFARHLHRFEAYVGGPHLEAAPTSVRVQTRISPPRGQ